MERESKAVRAIKYLIELAQMRSKTVREVQQYKQCLWLSEVPREPVHEGESLTCDTKAWGDASEGEDWLEVGRVSEPTVPTPPTACRDWLHHANLKDSSAVPSLAQQIRTPTRDAEELGVEHEGKLFETQVLADHPDVEATWARYVEAKWLPWAETHRRWKQLHDVYSKLFAIHQMIEREGERVELVMGVGLLSWKPALDRIRRHLVTARVELEFEARRGVFRVRPATTGASIQPEIDMIDIGLRPAGMEEDARNGLEQLGDDLWDRAVLDEVLRGMAHQLGEQGTYETGLAAEASAARNPVVELAPALLLRSRSMRGVVACLRTIQAQVEAGEPGPAGWIDLVEGDQSPAVRLIEAISGGEQPDVTRATKRRTGSDSIYFPLLWNEEQREIVSKLNGSKGALVQGPPGTGKSHTIANLICHLLATGKRILITAETPRALEVLEEKLPEEIRPLCVSLLGGGVEEQKSLQASVSGISKKKQEWRSRESDAHVRKLAGEREVLRIRIAKLRQRHRAAREKETFQHVGVGRYNGTGAEIARLVDARSGVYGWIEDSIPVDAELPLRTEELADVRRLLGDIAEGEADQLRARRPVVGEDLPGVDEFRTLVARHYDATRVLEEVGDGDLRWAEQVAGMLDHEVCAVIGALTPLERGIANIENRSKKSAGWIDAALSGVLVGDDRPWRELFDTTAAMLEGLRERARDVDRLSIHAPENEEQVRLAAQAERLRDHLKRGGGFGWWIFRPRAVRETRAVQGVHVEGQACRDVETLERFINAVRVDRDVADLWLEWEGKSERRGGSRASQVAHLEELHEALESVVDIYRHLESARSKLREIARVDDPAWDERVSRKGLLNSCRRREAELDLREATAALAALSDGVKVMSVRPGWDEEIAERFLRAACDCEVGAYEVVAEEVELLEGKKQKLLWREDALGRLRDVAPQFANRLAATHSNEVWNHLIGSYEEAWEHARARAWLQDFLEGEDDLAVIEAEVDRLEAKERDLTAREAAERAWGHCFERFTETHRRHLTSWQEAIKKIGKGTGKYVARHRRVAQGHLNECKDAIPAWVMPLHRVYETVDPQPGMFDLIIVDEASQCGPDAIPLFYLGEQILVIGDDKQISPSNVGVNREDAQRLAEQLLDDFEYVSSFDIDTSLFGQARIRLGEALVLREHFRCMPEIIRFSNDLCYQDSSLFPLRQYPPDRLEPLEHRHVVDGERAGKHQRTTNEREADAIVDAIAVCCADERYEGKSMGVITLQGSAQAGLIEGMLLDRIGGEEMVERRIVCGDAYSFQGDERHVIFLSMVAAPNMAAGSLAKAADERRFNVAASRAKDQMWLFHSVTMDDLSPRCVRRKLLKHFLAPAAQRDGAIGDLDQLRHRAATAERMKDEPPEPFESWFEVDVAIAIASRGYRVVPQFEMIGKYVDLMIEGAKGRLAVECDGDRWHGVEAYVTDVDRQRRLERAGLRFWRIRESAFHADRKSATAGLWEMLEEMGIWPVGEEPIEMPSLEDVGEAPQEAPVRDDEEFSESTAPERASDTSETTFDVDIEPYVAFPVSEELPDPRTNGDGVVIRALCRVIEVEGPMLRRRAFQVYARSFGAQRVGSDLRSRFESAMRKALDSGLVEVRNESEDDDVMNEVVRLRGTEAVRLRERGDRQIADIPPSELAAMMKNTKKATDLRSQEDLFRLTLQRYGINRTRQTTLRRLEFAWRQFGGEFE